MAPGCKRARLRPRTKGKFKGGLGWVLLWRAFFPSPLVGEGGALWSALALLSAPDEGSLSAETDPSPVSHLAMRATLSHKGRGQVSAARETHPGCFVISPPHLSRAMLSFARTRRAPTSVTSNERCSQLRRS